MYGFCFNIHEESPLRQLTLLCHQMALAVMARSDGQAFKASSWLIQALLRSLPRS
ncbi:protein of unknown function [Methylocella tundrae]|uniref:Uncharacterized protein n=1 Tax=Methylocella tundrae TaxID=227605 RepID=A0A4U8YZ52_METTU|nr:protein of unknown function [Methylocella tundrae]